MLHDEFDLYDTIIRDTSEVSSRRRQLDSMYVTLITFILTGEAYLAFYSYSKSYNNWVVVVAAAVISLLGLLVTFRWHSGQQKIGKVLQNRYDFLRKLEATSQLQSLGANIFTEEWGKFYAPRYGAAFRKLTISLQVTFMLVFILIPLLFVYSTANADGSLQSILNLLHL
jgi:hypothetical protein